MSADNVAGAAVVIVVHNSADVVDGCVASIPRDMDVIVVDNASADAVEQIVTRVRPDARYYKLDRNIGFGAACNRGARESDADVLVFLNPDARAGAIALQDLVARATEDRSSIYGPRMTDETGATRYICRRRSTVVQELAELLPPIRHLVPARATRDIGREQKGGDVYDRGGAVDYLQGACLAVWRETFEAVGGFDSNFFLYHEEEDLCDRIRAAGGRCIYVPSAVISHMWGTSTRKRPDLAWRHRYRSFVLLYSKRHRPSRTAVAAITLSVALLVRIMAIAVTEALGSPRAERSYSWANASLRGVLLGWKAAR